MSGAANAAARNVVGTVQTLWRYPVKSLLGESCDALALEMRGVVGDRGYALRTADGKFGSGKNTRRFRHVEGLFRFHATQRSAAPEIRFPDGWVMSVEDAGVHDALSTWLGQPVQVVPETGVSHFDQEPLHILTTAALAWLRNLLPDSKVDERRFRPNVLIDVPGSAQVERDWIGRTLAIGATARVRVVRPVERCGMVSLAQSDLPHDPRVLRCVTDAADLQFGVYAQVLTPGRIHVRDSVALLGE